MKVHCKHRELCFSAGQELPPEVLVSNYTTDVDEKHAAILVREFPHLFRREAFSTSEKESTRYSREAAPPPSVYIPLEVVEEEVFVTLPPEEKVE
jgi:hypothetical protein